MNSEDANDSDILDLLDPKDSLLLDLDIEEEQSQFSSDLLF